MFWVRVVRLRARRRAIQRQLSFRARGSPFPSTPGQETPSGQLGATSPHGPRHDSAVEELTEILVRELAGRARVRIQSAFVASDGSEPEPDVAVVPKGDYHDSHPTSAWLIMEVAESSLRKDRGLKAQLYAESGVGETVRPGRFADIEVRVADVIG